MNIIQLYQDYGIPYQTEGHKHCRPGWVNTACPFCTGNPGLHLGASLEHTVFYCWRCGYHPRKKAISKLLGITEQEAIRIIAKYSGKANIGSTKETKRKIRKKGFKLPSNISRLETRHKKYLEKRGYDPDKLERLWRLKGTGPISMLDKAEYKNRIIAPIYWNNEIVSFQGRDITNKHKLKYKACPKERELIDHKHILYGKQENMNGTGICVEGITDVWRFGSNSFCTFGIEYSFKQMKLMSKLFNFIAVVFDSEPQAQAKADELVAELGMRGTQAKKITIETDPGAMKQDDADHLVREIMKTL